MSPRRSTRVRHPGDRASGILLHVTSLPSPYGIGDLGPSAFAWVDRLARAGQSWWQALPLGPDRVRQLAVSTLVLLRGQRPPDQPRPAGPGRPPPGERPRRGVVPGGRGRLSRRSSGSSTGCWSGRGPTSGPGRVRTWARPSTDSATTRPTGWTTTPCSGP